MTKNYVSHIPYLRKHTSYDCDFWNTCVKWYLQVFFSVFQNFDFLGCIKNFLKIMHRIEKASKWSKMKKASEDAIILHTCTKNHNHMMYALWDREYDRCSISQKAYIIWLWFLVHVCKMMASPDAFFISFFFIFIFIFLVVTGVKCKKWPKMTKNSFYLTPYFSNCTSYDCDFCYTCVKWYLQQFFSFSSIF